MDARDGVSVGRGSEDAVAVHVTRGTPLEELGAHRASHHRGMRLASGVVAAKLKGDEVLADLLASIFWWAGRR